MFVSKFKATDSEAMIHTFVLEYFIHIKLWKPIWIYRKWKLVWVKFYYNWEAKMLQKLYQNHTHKVFKGFAKHFSKLTLNPSFAQFFCLQQHYMYRLQSFNLNPQNWIKRISIGKILQRIMLHDKVLLCLCISDIVQCECSFVLW